MREMSGLDYLKIDIANKYGHGLDKSIWKTRIEWFNDHQDNLHFLRSMPEKPIMYYKAVRAYEDTMKGIPSGHIMYLDATNSSFQIMAALSGCKQTALDTNLINSNKVNSAYNIVANLMNDKLAVREQVTSKLVKLPLMTKFYNKYEHEELTIQQETIFDNVIQERYEGPTAVQIYLNNRWDDNALVHSVVFPDGHTLYKPVTEMVDTRIRVDELDGVTFSYRYESNQPSTRSSSLVPDVIHGCDSFIVREMIRKCNRIGIQILPIHDAFGARCNNMNHIRRFYMEILAEIAASNLFQDILTQLGYTGKITKLSNDLDKYILDSEYMLS